jgi:hypothetical protein
MTCQLVTVGLTCTDTWWHKSWVYLDCHLSMLWAKRQMIGLRQQRSGREPYVGCRLFLLVERYTVVWLIVVPCLGLSTPLAWQVKGAGAVTKRVGGA